MIFAHVVVQREADIFDCGTGDWAGEAGAGSAGPEGPEPRTERKDMKKED